tara:strand:- start:321 stop:755 length:435 start_codon:yes stop_codon:yes gene_type:complete
MKALQKLGMEQWENGQYDAFLTTLSTMLAREMSTTKSPEEDDILEWDNELYEVARDSGITDLRKQLKVLSLVHDPDDSQQTEQKAKEIFLVFLPILKKATYFESTRPMVPKTYQFLKQVLMGKNKLGFIVGGLTVGLLAYAALR